ncbi:hypothetical protein [Methylomonas methanica]|uniref:Lipoprotein n=1 Tax=Methylomonas methanica (strain DSM 25384 / MC09) TaxID=857087 RepID=G0A321_METMM|nr:hypothetical protein [Methylomonas methanica]AEG02680.1 hypothetical protein Metme_4331 [Methylomonas methanica MC09]
MTTQTKLLFLLAAALAGCDQSERTQPASENAAAAAISDSEKVVESNVKSIEQNYEQQSYDTLPPKRED